MMNFMKRGSSKVVPLGITPKEEEEPLSGEKKTMEIKDSASNDESSTTAGTDDLSSSGSSRESLDSLDGETEETIKSDAPSDDNLLPLSETKCEQSLPSLVKVPEEEPLPSPSAQNITAPAPASSLDATLKSAAAPPPSRPTLVSRPRHRRTSSAMPRLETLHEGREMLPAEKPPLPPRKLSLSAPPSQFQTQQPKQQHPLNKPSTLSHSQSFRQLPNYPTAPERPKHRRTNSAPPRQPESFLDVTSLQQQLKQLQQQYGDQHAMVATTWNWLGNAFFRQGNMEAALQAYKKAVLCEPGEHLADAYANIGTVHWTTGNVEEAIPFLQNALSVHEFNVMSRGQDPNASLPVAGVQYQLGLALTLHKDYEQALFSLNQSRAIRERVLGHYHMDVARTLDAMGKANFLQGSHNAALECHTQALAIKESLPQGRSAIAVTIMNIVTVLRAQDALADARIWMHRLLAAQKNEFLSLKTKALCADIGASLCTLGEIYDSAMQYSEGAACYREAEMYFEKARIPAEDPRRRAVHNRLQD